MALKTTEIGTAGRLEDFFGRIDSHLKDSRKRESFAMYACGILGDGERKSAEPIAARSCADPEEVHNVHHKLLYFLGRSVWDDRAVRLEAARYAIEAIERREPITAWIVDDTGFLKQGDDSVGVQRQYTGSAGKITNCQIGVSLAVASSSEHLPLDFELYLPECWANDPARREQARIPDEVTFKTKITLALEMIERARKAGIAGEIMLADAAYGDSSEFRNGVRRLGFDFAVGIQSNVRVVRLDRRDRINEKTETVAELVQRLGRKAFRKLTWREGTGSKLSSRFCFLRVKTTHDDGIPISEREPLWLVAEWLDGEEKPTKFLLTTLARRMSRKQIVRICKERWRTERMYEDLKGELGLDHFEGRSFPGWHHHVSVVL
jgi:SRSO17 transposase